MSEQYPPGWGQTVFPNCLRIIEVAFLFNQDRGGTTYKVKVPQESEIEFDAYA